MEIQLQLYPAEIKEHFSPLSEVLEQWVNIFFQSSSICRSRYGMNLR
jgi:hypothetical protein